MQVGITQCAMWNSKLDEFLPEIGKAGYEVVELILRPEGELTTQTPQAGLDAIRKKAESHGVRIFSLALLHLTKNPIEGGDDRKKSVEEIRAGLRTAKAIGATSTLITLGRLRPDLCYDEAYRNAVLSLKEAGATAKELGVELNVEFVWNGFLFSPMEMKRFLEEIGSPAVGFYFDPGNMAVFQYPEHWLRILGKLTRKVHFKDWKGNALSGGWTGLLEGAVDFPALMRELRAIGYDGPLVSEVETNLAPLDKTAAAIRKIMTM
ncbi:MAG: sugar phosphate isomerase/epimerase [Planctomycetes bacterium]|nr:sugar phosphate isomerase/epimerase [Planctomycetota bacterium]